MKPLVFIFLACFPFCLMAQQQTEFSITIKSDNLDTSAKAYLKLNGKKGNPVAVKDGKFTFSGKVENPSLALVAINYTAAGQYSNYYQFYLSGGDVQLEIIDPKGKDEMNITGNKLCVDYEYKLTRPVLAQNKVIQELMAEYEEAKQKKEKDTLEKKKLFDEAVVKCFQIPQDYIKANTSSPVSVEALRFMGNGDPGSPVSLAQLETLFNSLDPAIKNSINGKKYAEDLAKWKM